METNPRILAPGFNLLPATITSQRSIVFYQTLVLLITFSAYAAFHASRKPPSIVKSVLGSEVQLSDTELGRNSSSIDIGWAPFDGRRGPHRLGELDLGFLSAYSIGMYFAGHIGDRVDLRLFLSFGMFASGISTVVFGLGYWWKIHSFVFFLLVQIVSGLFQSTGWPCVVAIMGNWFGKSKRGLIMGIWSSHTSVGNILGSVVASSVLAFGWGWSFVLPGIFIILVGFVVFLFLIVTPEDAGLESPVRDMEMTSEAEFVIASEEIKGEEEGLLQSGSPGSSGSSAAIGFLEAWRLPGVAPYAFCLFFSKLVAYTFLYWLPFYIRHTAVGGVHLSHETAGMLSTIFDIGGVFGGISAGYISDRIEARAVTSILFLIFSVPALILYRTCGSISMYSSTGLMFISGLLVNGPYSLITTAVASDLGTQSFIKGNSRALATVTAIIDGTGSVGAAVGPLLTGYISTTGWNSVFFMLIVAILLAILFLIHLARAEINSKLSEGKWFWESMPGSSSGSLTTSVSAVPGFFDLSISVREELPAVSFIISFASRIQRIFGIIPVDNLASLSPVESSELLASFWSMTLVSVVTGFFHLTISAREELPAVSFIISFVSRIQRTFGVIPVDDLGVAGCLFYHLFRQWNPANFWRHSGQRPWWVLFLVFLTLRFLFQRSCRLSLLSSLSPELSTMNNSGESEGTSTGSSAHRGRGKKGPTMAHNISRMPEGHKIPIILNELGQPCNGTNTSKLITWIVTLARKNYTLLVTILSWPDVPQPVKEDNWKQIKAKFNIPESGKKWALEKPNQRWKGYKHNLKIDFYEKYDSEAE
ncbi:hypothetical protein NE237_031054 [Protea cynaroides]|uniref:Major facilitator superfamily (MFS) profile domain-containing protein n=1 Tax=Protea cynaroides TaxID=273540 RepID=A0A9Q0GYC4_9MAGN|nr:hypothetical protein NE237_031054 [Protea cynaroides]